MSKLNEELERKINSELHKSAILRAQATDVIDDINALLSGYKDIKAQYPDDNNVSYRNDILNLLEGNEINITKEELPETESGYEIHDSTPEIALNYFSRGNPSEATTVPVASSDVFMRQSEVLERLRLYKELAELETATDTSALQAQQGVSGLFAKMIGISKDSGDK